MDRESWYIPIMCHKVCQITKAEMCVRNPLTSVFPLYREMEISFRVFYVSLEEQWVWWCNNCLLKKSKRLWSCLTRKSCGRLWNPLWSQFCNLASLAFFLRRWTRMARMSGLAGLLGAGWKIPCQQNFVMVVWLLWYSWWPKCNSNTVSVGEKDWGGGVARCIAFQMMMQISFYSGDHPFMWCMILWDIAVTSPEQVLLSVSSSLLFLFFLFLLIKFILKLNFVSYMSICIV